MKHLCVELFVLGRYDDENHERQRASLFTFDENDIDELGNVVKDLANCGLDLLLETDVYETEE